MALDTIRAGMQVGENDYVVSAVTDDYRTWKVTATKDGEPVALGTRRDGSGIMRSTITWKGSAQATAVGADNEVQRVMNTLTRDHIYGI